MEKDKTTKQDKKNAQDDAQDKHDKSWADEATKARTSDDPRARSPRDAAGQPSARSFDE